MNLVPAAWGLSVCEVKQLAQAISVTHTYKNTQPSYKRDYECEKGKQAHSENRKASRSEGACVCVCVCAVPSFSFKCDSD